MTSPSNSSGRVLGKNYSSFLDFTRNYERMSGIFVYLSSFNTLKVWLRIALNINTKIFLAYVCHFSQFSISYEWPIS